MSNQFVKGAIIITIGTMLSKVLGSVFRIPLQNIAGDEVLGIFSIVYPVYMTVLTLTVAGIPLAISKLISQARANEKNEEIFYIYRTAAILTISFGIISFSLVYLFVDQISQILGGSFVVYPLIVVSITLLLAPYMAVYRGLFQGFENMNPTAISQVIEQFVRVLFILAAAYILTVQHYSDEMVTAGVMVGNIIGVLASLVYLKIVFRKAKHNIMEKVSYQFRDFHIWGKQILKVAIPICIGAIAMPLLNMVDSLTVPFQLKQIGYMEEEVTYLYGIYGRGIALEQIAVVFASAMILPLIPHITAAITKNEIARTKQTIERANKFTHLTAWPAAIGVVALTAPINLSLFTDLEGNAVIALLTLSSLFTAFSVLSTGILQGMNKSNQAALIVMICAVLKIVLNIVLVKQFDLIGAAVATLIIYMILTTINMIVIYRQIRFKLLQRENVMFALGSIIMGLIVASPWYLLDVNWTRVLALIYVVIMIIIGAIIYLAFIILTKGLRREELELLPFIGKRLKNQRERMHIRD